MTIAQMREHSNRAISRVPKDLLIVLLVLTTSSLAFGLGMLAQREVGQGRGVSSGESGFWIETLSTSTPPLSAAAAVGTVAGVSTTNANEKDTQPNSNLPYVASRNGETYYLATCKSSERIKPENRIFFATEAEAKTSGRRPAANCPGL